MIFLKYYFDYFRFHFRFLKQIKDTAMKFLETAEAQTGESIFKQDVVWRVTLTADFPPAQGKRVQTHTVDVVDTPYRAIAIKTAHHALEQHSHKMGDWQSMSITISKQSKLPTDTV
jgi:hypothetical protein